MRALTDCSRHHNPLSTMACLDGDAVSSIKIKQMAASGGYIAMKIKNSLKALKSRHRANRVVRRKGRVYIINKVAPRFKARQG